MAEHLVVLQHGICGTPLELENVAAALNRAFPGRLRTLLSRASEGATMDGVEAGGRRLAALVKDEAPRSGGCISFICHSLGGIYARHALRTLEVEGWFESSGVRAANFVTTASPHLGIMEIGSFWRKGIWCLQFCLGSTIRDLALVSDAVLKLTDDVGIRSLERFHRRVVYGNLDDDMWVRPCSALLLASPPDLTEENLVAGVPHEVAEVKEASCDAESFAAFPREKRATVQGMWERLLTMQWLRYAVYFPYKRWSGKAHDKICNHKYDDVANDGVHVVEHICKSFVDLPSS